MLRYLPLLAWKWPMKCTMVFSSSAAALPGRREWAGGQPAVAPTLGNILYRMCSVSIKKLIHSNSGTLKYTRSRFYAINLGSLTKDFLVFKTQLWPWPATSKLMKIWGFQKCKEHSSSIKGFRITTCQSWCNSRSVKKLKVFIGGAVFIWKMQYKRKI